MKLKTLAASLFVLAVFVPVAQAFTKGDATRYERAYAHARHVFGKQAVGCRLFETCHGKVSDGKLASSTDVLHRMFAPPPRPAPVVPTGGTAYTPTVSSTPSYSQASVVQSQVSAATASAAANSQAQASYSGGNYSNVAGVPASFAACVATRESSNGAGSSNIYGIVPGSGSNAGSGTLAQQKAAFSQLYAAHGTAPWAPYDHCS